MILEAGVIILGRQYLYLMMGKRLYQVHLWLIMILDVFIFFHTSSSRGQLHGPIKQQLTELLMEIDSGILHQ